MNDKAFKLKQNQVEIMVPLADVEKRSIKDKQNPKQTKTYYNVQPYLYQQPQSNKDSGIYVDDSHVTHGVLFPGVNVFTQAGNGLCIFKHPLHQIIDPKSELTIEQKNQLDPMFKAIMTELNLEADKDTPIKFEAGKLKDLLLNPRQQRRLTGIIAKHDSEWKKTKSADFKPVYDAFRGKGKGDTASGIEKRVEDLSIKLEVDGFNSGEQAYYMHPLGVIGWLIKNKELIDRDFFFSQYEKLFEKLTSSQKQALENIFTGIEEYIEADSSYICTLPKIAYMLATAKHETDHTFEPITEKGGLSYFNKYDPVLADTRERRARAIDMENTQKGDGYKYRGRGYVQLTWKKNYRKSGEYLKKDLVNNPELALDQKYATKIMIYGMETGMFTGKKMSNYISNSNKDYLNARRIINGTDKALTIAGYASKLEECLRWL
ncbi:glycoside hydrolase family 19 protein [Rodentibacter genomosp. 2]|uniref:glycoside hydrolase family 19 protein n=1 Tax=Rodentibacter genomosp. 2 TaxID=1908266 RepID=UPI001FCA1D1D